MKRLCCALSLLLALGGCVRALPPLRTPDRVLSARTSAALATAARVAALEAHPEQGVSSLPPPPPPQDAPAEAQTPPTATPSRGVLAIEVDDGPARVERVVWHTVLRPTRVLVSGNRRSGDVLPSHAFVEVEPVCVAPCVARVPYGAYELRITPLDVATRDDRLGPRSQQESLESSAVYRSANTVAVVVNEAPSALRVTLGRRRAPAVVQSAGALTTLIGAGLTLLGGIMLPTGAVLGQTDVRDGSIIALSIGALGTLVGTSLLSGYPSEVRPASSTQWDVP
ncbi:MAG: hypothetical protein Q8Q09_23940 [Deltaproteobacteria bacterium]|nr:hypothetical protein [Deltaproteobacteria bacterium]